MKRGTCNGHLKQKYELTMDEGPDSVEPGEMPTIAAEDYGDTMAIYSATKKEYEQAYRIFDLRPQGGTGMGRGDIEP